MSVCARQGAPADGDGASLAAGRAGYRDIWHYIANDNPDAADRLLRQIDAKLQLYALNPRMGAMRDNLAPELRSFSVGNYLAFYRTTAEGIELVRVLHGSRNLRHCLILGSEDVRIELRCSGRSSAANGHFNSQFAHDFLRTRFLCTISPWR